jgi:surface antigen
MKAKNLVVAVVLALTSIGFAPLSANAELSGCARNGLIGAGVGAAVGVLTSHHHQLQSGAVGAAVGGVGTYAVCRMLSNNDQSRVERNYHRALNRDNRVTDSWGTGSNTKYLTVNRPTSAGHGCRQVTGRISDTAHGSQDLPPETFCRDSEGRWTPS